MTFKAFLQHGSADKPPMRTEEVRAKVDELPWQTLGLSYTATGYGARIPTRYKVRWAGRWYRVYCAQFSNAGAMYIESRGEKITVDIQAS